jgi:putative endonuclease
MERGYELVARNWRTREAELDLVLVRGSEMVFCEVKTRTSDRFGSPAEAVTWAKQQKIRSAALSYLAAARQAGAERPANLRFDVACVVGQAVEVIEGAF